MNSKYTIKEIDTNNSNQSVGTCEAALYLLPFIAPIIYKVIDKIGDFAHDAMVHGYDLKVKAGSVEVVLTKNDKINEGNQNEKIIGI